MEQECILRTPARAISDDTPCAADQHFTLPIRRCAIAGMRNVMEHYPRWVSKGRASRQCASWQGLRSAPNC